MLTDTIVIGTRGSKLALWQTEEVRKKLLQAFPHIRVDVKIISTRGDEILDVALSKIGDKGLFTKELENELLHGGIDMAVHSLKDLPTDLPDAFIIGGVLERGDFRDALVSRNHKKLDQLSSHDVVATSSLRRRAGLLSLHPQAQITDIRGNVNTRLRKMEEGYCDAIIMAAAGLQRLGLEHYIAEILDPEVMIPAVSQGVIAMEIRRSDERLMHYCTPLHHLPTWIAVSSERAFMRTLQGGCQVPVGCYTCMHNNNITITGFVATSDGLTYLKEKLTGPAEKAEGLGIQLAEKLLEMGGDVILRNERVIV